MKVIISITEAINIIRFKFKNKKDEEKDDLLKNTKQNKRLEKNENYEIING